MHRLAKILALAWTSMFLSAQALADEDYCSYYKTGDDIVLVLIDLTSRPEGVFQNSLEQAAAWLGKNVAPGQRVVIESIVDDSLRRDKLFNECRPGKKMGLFDRPLNTARIEHDEKDFSPLLRDAVLNAWRKTKYGWTKNNNIRKSVISGTISAASQNLPKGSILSLVLVSDLLEKDDLKLPPEIAMGSFEIDEAMAKIRHNSGFGNIEGTNVQIYGFGFSDFEYDGVTKMRKPLPPETRKNLEVFWRRYFAQAKAKSVFIEQ
ncbi:exported hypothetical protein [Rhodospirillaceae bacterium LM-1]|nr:exported hypothetical protein [Rhodospirillaceae bacterium LM-1]